MLVVLQQSKVDLCFWSGNDRSEVWQFSGVPGLLRSMSFLQQVNSAGVLCSEFECKG